MASEEQQEQQAEQVQQTEQTAEGQELPKWLTDSSAELDEEEFAEAMGFDPFKQAAEAVAPENQEAGQEDGQQASQEETEPQATEEVQTIEEPEQTQQVAVEQQAPSPAETELALLKAQNQQLQQQIQLLQMQGQQATQQPGQQNQQAQQQSPFNLNVSDDIINAMGSEEPAVRKQGLNTLLNALATRIRDQITQNDLPQAIQTHVPQYVQQGQQSSAMQQQIASDFYGQFPQLNNDQLRPFVHQVAEQVMRETGAQSWTAELRNAIGMRVLQSLRSIQTLPGQQQQTTQTQARPAAPVRQVGGAGARPALNRGNSQEEAIRQTLGF